MSPREVELALKKQRLQIQSAVLRAHLVRQTRAFEPTFAAADMVRAGYTWLRDRPYIVIGAAVALAVARPRGLWRWITRGAMWWQTARQLRRFVGQYEPVFSAWRAARGAAGKEDRQAARLDQLS